MNARFDRVLFYGNTTDYTTNATPGLILLAKLMRRETLFGDYMKVPGFGEAKGDGAEAVAAAAEDIAIGADAAGAGSL